MSILIIIVIVVSSSLAISNNQDKRIQDLEKNQETKTIEIKTTK